MSLALAHRRGRLPVVAALLVTFLAAMATVPSIASAQSSAEVQILDVDASDAAFIELEIAIPPEIGDVEPSAASFALTDNGQRRDLQVEALGGAVDVILAIDTSGSMQGEPLAAAKRAAKDFVERSPEGTRIGVIGFGATVTIQGSLEDDADATLAAIDSLTASGETAMWDALAEASLALNRSDDRGTYVVVLSDGADTVSTVTEAEVTASLRRRSTSLYAVVLQSSEVDGAGLNRATAAIGGQFLTVADTEALQPLYADIADRLANRYLLRFVPGGGGDRRVAVSVAVDGAIATAATTVTLASAPSAATPVALDRAAVPAEVGAIVAGATDWRTASWSLWVGAGFMAVALAYFASLITLPAAHIRSLGGGARGVGRLTTLNERMSTAADRLVEDRDRGHSLNRALDSAGIDIRPGEFVVMLGVATTAGAMLGFVTGGPAGAIGLAAVVLIAGVSMVQMKGSRRRAAFSEQLIDTITIITGSLRAGRGLPQALELVAQEAPSPASDEFARVVIESRVGRDPIESLSAVSERMQSEDMRWITQAIGINRELGGDLVEVLDNVADTIRDRVRIKRQVRSLSAEGRISGWVLLALPIVMYVYLRLVNPGYVGLLTDTTVGLVMLGVGVVAMILGALWIRRLVDLKY